MLQDFHERPVCFSADGNPCDAPDVSVLSSGFLMARYLRARIDADDQLLVAAIATRYPTGPDASARDMGVVARLSRFDHPLGGEAADLVSTGANHSTVALPPKNQRFVLTSWDVSPGGMLLYADPDGAYRVFIGPATGRAPLRPIALPVHDDDDEHLAQLKEKVGLAASASIVSRIIATNWVDDERFMVQPTAAASLPEDGLAGTWEVFRTDGTSLGRFEVRCDIDVSADITFVQRDALIVVKGGRSAVMARFRDSGLPLPPPDLDQELLEHIEVRRYDLFGGLR
ncbi:MAG TPA: hypothetical protein VFX92_00645 [Candidatus Krumholzibacteria bacterium]|nr:hypothetical protein [Candidatus Krumholzibacteria bacterium]